MIWAGCRAGGSSLAASLGDRRAEGQGVPAMGLRERIALQIQSAVLLLLGLLFYAVLLACEPQACKGLAFAELRGT